MAGSQEVLIEGKIYFDPFWILNDVWSLMMNQFFVFKTGLDKVSRTRF
jgi:hypothetical protein